jgi:hypothetical protein
MPTSFKTIQPEKIEDDDPEKSGSCRERRIMGVIDPKITGTPLAAYNECGQQYDWNRQNVSDKNTKLDFLLHDTKLTPIRTVNLFRAASQTNQRMQTAERSGPKVSRRH